MNWFKSAVTNTFNFIRGSPDEEYAEDDYENAGDEEVQNKEDDDVLSNRMGDVSLQNKGSSSSSPVPEARGGLIAEHSHTPTQPDIGNQKEFSSGEHDIKLQEDYDGNEPQGRFVRNPANEESEPSGFTSTNIDGARYAQDITKSSQKLSPVKKGKNKRIQKKIIGTTKGDLVKDKAGKSENASAEGDKWLLNWVGENEDREDVLKEVSSLNKVADLTRENIKKWRASDSAKKEMESLWKVVKSKLIGPLKITTMEGKASKLDLGENSYFDVSRLEGCCVSPEESDHTSSDKWFTHGSSQETEGATIESAYIHSIKDLWNKMEITEGDAFAMIDKRTHGLVKLAWLPDIGNEEITTCLVTIKSHPSFKNQPLKGKRKSGQTHEIHSVISYKRVFIVLHIWGNKNDVFEITEVKEEYTLESSIFKYLDANHILYEVFFSTDGKMDITTYVKGNPKIEDLLMKAKETKEFLAKPFIEVTHLGAIIEKKEPLQPIYKLQCSIKELDDFEKTEFYKHEHVNTGKIKRLHEKMKKLQTKLIDSMFMGSPSMENFDTELEGLMKKKEALKIDMTKAILPKVCSPSLKADTATSERQTTSEGLSDREEEQENQKALGQSPKKSPRPELGDKKERIINVILVGKTGSGKSATGSLLLERPVFKSSGGVTSETKPEDIKVCETMVDGVKYRIMDTPGLFDTEKKHFPFILAIERIANEFPDGVHAIIYVMNGDTRFTAEEAETVRVVREKNGDDQFKYAALLVTRGNKLFQQPDMDAKKYISDIKQEIKKEPKNPILGSFQELIESIGKRVIFIENNDESRLLKEIQKHCVFRLIGEIASENTTPYHREAWDTMRKLRQIRGEGEAQIPAIVNAVAPDLLEKHSELSGWLEGEVSGNEIDAFKFMIKEHSPLQKDEKKLLLDYIDADPDAFLSMVKKSQPKSEEGKEPGPSVFNKVQTRNILRHKLFERFEVSTSNPVFGKSGEESEQPNILTNIIEDLKKDPKMDPLLLDAVKEEMTEMLKEMKCFPSSVCVVTKSGEKPLSDIKVGDYVLSACPNGDITYSPVVMFSHKDEELEGLYLNITTEGNKSIALSHNHFLHEGHIGDLKEGRLIKPGDKVFLIKNGKAVPEKVTNVELVFMRGAICPHTATGNIIVNGVVASCYTALVYPWLAHLLMTPLRFFHKIAPESLFKNVVLYDRHKGMPILLLKLRDVLL